MTYLALKTPLRSKIGGGMRTNFPPPRLAPRNRTWEQYARWRDSNFEQFSTATGNNLIEAPIFSFITEFWPTAVVPERLGIEVSGRAADFMDALHDPLILAIRTAIEYRVTYGCGVFDNRMPMAPRVVDPRFWLPTRLPYDSSIVVTDEVAYPYSDNIHGTADRIRVTTFEDVGAQKIETSRSYRLEGLSIGASVGEGVSSPVPESVLVPVSSDNSLYGVSDYRDIVGYVKELHRRESAVSSAQDKQSNPHLILPESAIIRNADGSVTIDKDGQVIPIQDNDTGRQVQPMYLTWDAKFGEQETTIDRILDRIWWSCKISPTLLNRSANRQTNLHVPSGSALRRLALETVLKVRAMREVFTPAIIRTVIAQRDAVFLAGGEYIELPDNINVDWGPPLAFQDDEAEEAVADLERGNR